MSMAETMDIERLRAETSGCEKVLHFNNAGAALMPKAVLDTVIGYLQLEVEMGGYEAAQQEQPRIQAVYDSVAKLIGANRDEIALVQNATRAWQQAFYSIQFQPGDRILTSVAEYANNYVGLLHLSQKTGAIIEVVPNDEMGQISVRALQSMLDERVKLIALTHVPTNGGLVNPAEGVGRIAREAGVLYLLDACQSVGQMPLNVEQIGCDFLSATSRKYLRGPRGAGFLYVRQERLTELEPPTLDLQAAELTSLNEYWLREDARRFESWEVSYAVNLGLGAAVDYALSIGMEAIWQRIQYLASLLRCRLAELPGVTLQDLGELQCGIVTLTVQGHIPQSLCDRLRQTGINTSVSPPVSTLLDMTARQLTEGLLRASVHYYNTEAEIERFCEQLERLIRS